MIRILFAGDRYWSDLVMIGNALLAAVAAVRARGGHDDGVPVTLVHGQGDPRLPGGQPIKWETAVDNPQFGPYIGGDWLAHWFAVWKGWTLEPHPADWPRFKLAAGPIRNQQMVDAGADQAVGMVLRRSRGTRGCMQLAEAAGIPTTLYPIGSH